MKSTTPKAGSVVAAVITITLGSWSMAACGSGETSLNADEQAVADVFAQDLQAGGDGLFTPTESQCFGDKVVKELGVERLSELGVTTATPEGVNSLVDNGLTADEANKLVDALDGCVDLKAALAKVGTDRLGPEVGSCLSDNLSDDLVRALIRSEVLEQDSAVDQQALDEIRAECGIG